MASIRKLGDGRWQAQYRPVPGGKQRTRTTHRRSDAQRWLDEQTTALLTGAYVDPVAGRVTFADYYRRWAARQVWAPGTERGMDLAARTVTFAQVPMHRLTRAHVESWVKHMHTNGLAASTIHTRVHQVRSALRGAVRDRVITADPSDRVPLPRMGRAAAVIRLPTPGQVGDLLDVADPQFRVLVLLCAFGGLRLGEVTALQVGDLDVETGKLTVCRQVQRTRGGGIDIRAPKHGSHRVVYLADGVSREAHRHIEHLPGTSVAAGWLFPDHHGQPWNGRTVNSWWRHTRAAAGHPMIRLHDLRHFYASGLISAGCDVVTVQRALGHANATVTLSTYAHLWPTSEDRTRAAAAGMLTETLRSHSDEHVTNTPSTRPPDQQ